MYHADMDALRAGQYADLAVLAETQRHLAVLRNNRDLAEELDVPDGSRRIFDTPEKHNWLDLLSIEMDELLSNVYSEIDASRLAQNRTLGSMRNLAKNTSV
jgi:hypothetical protein